MATFISVSRHLLQQFKGNVFSRVVLIYFHLFLYFLHLPLFSYLVILHTEILCHSSNALLSTSYYFKFECIIKRPCYTSHEVTVSKVILQVILLSLRMQRPFWLEKAGISPCSQMNELHNTLNLHDHNIHVCMYVYKGLSSRQMWDTIHMTAGEFPVYKHFWRLINVRESVQIILSTGHL